jgi:hypothetical protein
MRSANGYSSIVLEAADLLGVPRKDLLDSRELDALEGRRSPHGVIIPVISDEA